jgi:plasmid stabilization system protein ParE
MRFEVIWEDIALEDLAQIWMDAEDRDAVRAAASRVDLILANDPDTKGEEFYGGRLLDVDPLHVMFTVRHDDRKAVVLHVWKPGT